jgi:hypothetical protein
MKAYSARIVACASAMLICVMNASPGSADSSKAPYTAVPTVGQAVRLDGTPGGAKTAWAYNDVHWLERYLGVTIDAAAANRPYTDLEVQNQLNTIADHVTVVPNGTKASVEAVQSFSYGGRQDMEVRVMIGEGALRGRELWTTCAELVDSAGHPYLRM